MSPELFCHLGVFLLRWVPKVLGFTQLAGVSRYPRKWSESKPGAAEKENVLNQARLWRIPQSHFRSQSEET